MVPVEVDAAAKEWSMLEFQGDLLPGDGAETTDLKNVDVGTLRYGEGGEITLRIGNHVLAGKVTKLPKPFAILQKVNAQGDVVVEDNEVEAVRQTKYEVVGIARTRVVFASRPKPVLG
ncbi:Chromosome transmission fidelity protein 8 [Phytophthora citrophthora]|uniref:Chromosome transmission fidelity protein 8 n=1 Tax=Phytophthora citrophthora TaxID=4793 RepID=A0AAD9GLL2_9STRA|nr:Chromosome transmission fidelity protein 8 [Phytophthora citrophthora]